MDNIDKPFIKRDASIRWQRIQIEQLGYFSNMIFLLAAGYLGYLINLIMDTKLNYIIFLMILDLVLICISLYLAWNRLQDFRVTKDIAFLREDINYGKFSNQQILKKEIEKECLKLKSKKLGQKTWVILGFQMWVFLFVVVTSIIAVIIY